VRARDKHADILRKEVKVLRQIEDKYKWKCESIALTFLMKTQGQVAQMAMPGTGFRAGTGSAALGFIGLGPGAGPRRMLPTWFAELALGRPICGGGAI
jgi:hypothetical protein